MYIRAYIHTSIHWSVGSVPVGVQCPGTSSLNKFLGYWAGFGILQPLDAEVLCVFLPPFPSPAVSLCFSMYSSSPAIGFHSYFFLYGRRICTHPVDPSLGHFLGEFPGLGLALVPDV